MAPTDERQEEAERGAIGILDLLRLAMDFVGADVGGGVLRQQRLGAAGLLRGVLLLAAASPSSASASAAMPIWLSRP